MIFMLNQNIVHLSINQLRVEILAHTIQALQGFFFHDSPSKSILITGYIKDKRF